MSDGRPQRHVFLIGFMAAGKSAVGRMAAAHLGVPLIDLDERIERSLNAPVGTIIGERGLDEFRRVEAEELARVARGPAAVIATGGGAPTYRENMALMRARGLVIALFASLDSVRVRAQGDDQPVRPLLLQPWEDVRALYEARAPIYRQAHAGVDTDPLSASEVAARVVDIARAAGAVPGDLLPQSHLLSLRARAYPIVVADGLLDRLGELARAFLPDCGDPARVAVISDENVAPLYGERALDRLRQAGFQAALVTVPAGERSKSFTEVARLCRELAAQGLDRRSAVIALGGGVVGDLAGFVASTLFRGVEYIQVPTSAVAMIDAAIGGKTGIDLPEGKNLVGTFWQPRAVIADLGTLVTLPAREQRAAFGELVKYGLLEGEALYAAVDELARAADLGFGGGSAPATLRLAEVLRACAAAKSRVVGRDERDLSGERALLNLGHTVGHAIEAASAGAVIHGEAVALGLIAACRVSARLALCAGDVEARVTATLESAGLATSLEPWLGDNVLGYLGADKKRAGRDLDFVVVHRIGGCGRHRLSVDELSRILRLGSAV